MKQIAKDMGATTRNLYRFMLTGLGDEKYQELVTQCLVCRIADADDELEKARDQVEVQKWREIARFARLDFERRRPQLYGPKATVQAVVVPGMDGELAESMKKLLDVATERVKNLPPMGRVIEEDADAS